MTHRYDAADLHRFYREALTAAGASEDSAGAAADGILYADVHGIDTHGALGFNRIYLPGLRDGRITGDAVPSVVQSAHATAQVDGANALGFAACSLAADEAVRRAAVSGVGAVGVFNSSHAGSVGFYARRIASHGAIGVVFTNLGSQRMLRAPGGTQPLVGSNALAAAVPSDQRPAFCIDMSTAVVSAGRIRVSARRNEQVPAGWLTDARGVPVHDPHEFDRGQAGLQLLGGEAATGGHKGFGLALLADVLCGLLTGSAIGPEPAPVAEDPLSRVGSNIGHFLLALDVGSFVEPKRFLQRVSEMLDTITSSPTMNGGRVTYPGLPESVTAEARTATGIPLDGWLANALVEDALAMSIAPPSLLT